MNSQYDNRFSGSVSRTMAAVSLGFIVMVTPWAIQEVVAACTGSKVTLFSVFWASYDQKKKIIRFLFLKLLFCSCPHFWSF